MMCKEYFLTQIQILHFFNTRKIRAKIYVESCNNKIKFSIRKKDYSFALYEKILLGSADVFVEVETDLRFYECWFKRVQIFGDKRL